MRNALRTAIATAALAGAAIVPFAAAGSAFAAVPTTVAAASEYDGREVLIAPGRLAVLQNGDQGPKVWVRAVAKDWKPGDGWAGRVLGTLDPAHPTLTVDDLSLELQGTTSTAPVLKVTGPDGTHTYPLPTVDAGSPGQGPVTPVGEKLGKRTLANGGYAELYEKATRPELWLITCGDIKDGHRPDNIILYADLVA
ncbi:hypothetical protein GCM10020367_39840 [Streptomyces sannanensis]|uniref:Sortase n=1 Tax=Streptomyces sannanensis TaxID=285536 RepID=A0ABP6SED6_9ACTN